MAEVINITGVHVTLTTKDLVFERTILASGVIILMFGFALFLAALFKQ